MSGVLYATRKDSSGGFHIDGAIAIYEDGKIYLAADGFKGVSAKRELVGEYKNGKVYRLESNGANYGNRLNLAALYEDGKIFSVTNNTYGGISKALPVGECISGNVYSCSNGLFSINETLVKYSGDDEGAAATAAIVLFELHSNVPPNVGNYSQTTCPHLSDDSSSKSIKNKVHSSENSYGDDEFGWLVISLLLPSLFMSISIFIFEEEYRIFGRGVLDLANFFYLFFPGIVLLSSIGVTIFYWSRFSIWRFLVGIIGGIATALLYVLTVNLFLYEYIDTHILDDGCEIIYSFFMFMLAGGLTNIRKK